MECDSGNLFYMGAKGKYSTKRVERLCELLRQGVTVKGAAHGAGVCEKTFYQWRNLKPGFAEATDKAIASAESMLVQIALDGTKRNPHLAIQLLERRFPDWARHTRQESKVDVHTKTTVSPEVLKAFASVPEQVRVRQN